jgi:MiaB-like tRNA modifying enzyme
MKIYLEVYGCTANKSDASIVRGILSDSKGYQLVDTVEQADVFLILTCTVIATTEQRMISRIKHVQQLGKRIVVSGCMASIQQDLIHQFFPDAVFLPPQQIHQITRVLEQNPVSNNDRYKYNAKKTYDDFIAPISIAEGCQFSCHYCITRKARGKLKSFPKESIYHSVQTAVQQGCNEIQLTAQDTASYGMDQNSNLGELLQYLSSIEGSYWIRVGMMNPRSVKPNLSAILKAYDNPNVYKFLHLPIQSGSDDLLKLMNRGYTIFDVQKILQQFRVQFPTLVVSTDIIVGFPGETDEQYQQSVSLLHSIKPDVINITRFSARPYTKAKTMKQRIPTDIVKQRSTNLTQIAKMITTEKNNSYIGESMSVLITEKGRSQSMLARADNYKPVVIKQSLPIGKQVRVTITDATEIYLIGMLK